MSPVSPLLGQAPSYDILYETDLSEQSDYSSSSGFDTPESETWNLIAGSAFGFTQYDDKEPASGFSLGVVLSKVADTSTRLMNQLLSLMGGGSTAEEVVVPQWSAQVVQPAAQESLDVAPPAEAPNEVGTHVASMTPLGLIKEFTPSTAESAVIAAPLSNTHKTLQGVEWKPLNRYGLAEVTLPATFRGRVASVELRSNDQDKVLATSIDAGVNLEGKAVWRFSQPGELFPSGAILVVTTKDGESQQLSIAEPAKTSVI